MVTLSELKEQAMTLSDSDRAKLATSLLCSLDPVPDDDGYAEAMRRRKEMDEDPSALITFEELKKSAAS